MYTHNAVLIDLEGNLYLGDTSGGRGNTIEIELPEDVVIAGHLSLALEYLDQHTWLVIGVCGEGLGLFGRDGGVTGDEDRHDTTCGFDTEGEGCDVNEQEAVGLFGALSGEDGGLDGRAVGNCLIGIDGAVGFLTVEELTE